MRAPEQLLTREMLERLERLTIRWSRSFQGGIGGEIVSRYSGVGHEFMDHRQFQRGDDLRAVNWRAYMRLERMFLKLFRSEPRIPVRILIDTSESMACGGTSADDSKFAYACRLAAALCYVGLVRLETIVLQPFSNQLAEAFRAQGGRLQYASSANYLSKLETSGQTNFNRPIRDYLMRYRMPGLTFVLSDFLDTGQEDLPLQYLTDEGHEVHLLHISGSTDREPPWRGELELHDAETDQVMRVSLDEKSAIEYRQAYDEFCNQLEQHTHRSGAQYLHLETTTPLEHVLFRKMPATGMEMRHL